MSGHATIDSAVMAVRTGAMDYPTKPFDLQRLRQLLASVRTDLEERRVLLGIEGDAARHIEFGGMIGRGHAMQKSSIWCGGSPRTRETVGVSTFDGRRSPGWRVRRSRDR